MSKRIRGFFWAGLLLSCLVGLSGCGQDPTSIDPPSGPLGTEVCFYPTPLQFVDFTGEACGWYVQLHVDIGEERPFYNQFYVSENCFEFPSYPEVSPGDVANLTIAPDWGVYFGHPCGLHSYPDMENFGGKYGTFTVTE